MTTNLIKASAILLVLLGIISVSSFIENLVVPQQRAEEERLDSSDLLSSIDSDVESELLSLSSFDNVVASPDQRQISFQSQLACAELTDLVKSNLLTNGWHCTAQENDFLLTFSKNEGRFFWAVFSCSDIGGSSVALLQIA